MSLPGYSKVLSKNVSPFGPDFWPAIGNIYTNVLFYYIDILIFSNLLEKRIILSTFLLYSTTCRLETLIYLYKFRSCSKRFNCVDVRTVNIWCKFKFCVPCGYSLIEVIIFITTVTPFIFYILGLVSVFYSYYCCFPQCLYCNLPRGYNW